MRRADAVEIARHVEVDALDGGDELRVGGRGVVGEARHGDGSVGVVQRRQHSGKGADRVGGAAAMAARVQVLGRAGHRDVERDETAAGDGHRGQIVPPLGAVSRNRDVAGEPVAQSLNGGFEMRAAAFLLALDEELEVDRRRAGDAVEGGGHEDRGEHRSLVVGGAAGIEPVVAHFGLEGRALPAVQGIGRLHVVVAVDEDGRRGGIDEPLTEDAGMAAGIDALHHGNAGVSEPGRDEVGGARDVGGEGRIGADARDAAERLEGFERLVGVSGEPGLDAGEIGHLPPSTPRVSPLIQPA